MAMLKIQRNSSLINRIRSYRIYIDGKKVGNIANGQSFNIEVLPGSHTVVAKIDWCSSPTITFLMNADEVKKMSVGPFKYSNWILPIGIWVVLSVFALNMIYESLNYGLISLPVAGLFLYYLTFGRKKYLTLNIINTEIFKDAEPPKFSS